MEISIINHGSNDYLKMVELRTEILRKPLNLVYTQEQLSLEKSDLLIVAKLNTEVVGCCILTQLVDNQVQLRQMAVAESHQNSGVGAKIIDFAEKTVKENKQKSIVLHARETAVNFYIKKGFYIFGDEFFEVGIKHFMMEKPLVLP
jgi:predicted GNAT family N-acyltransferase